MIIECKSCLKKFFVKDSEIAIDGRTVQCSNCSEQWLQMPAFTPVTVVKTNINENLSVEELEASDGKTYRFMGMRWAEVLPSGKTGVKAKRQIATELNQLAGREIPKTVRKIDKREKYRKKKIKIDLNSKIINPSTEQTDRIDPSTEQTDSEIIKQEKQGIGFFGYIFLLIIITLSTIGVLKTFQNEFLMYFPKGEYIFETIDNMIIMVKELIKSY